MKEKIQLVLVITNLMLISSCNYFVPSDVPVDVKRVIHMAGKNKHELISAIRYYKSGKDSLKLKALYFLIVNMEDYYSYYGTKLEKYDSLFKQTGEIVDVKKKWDSLETRLGKIDKSELERRFDLEAIKASFLIDNIEGAFKAWRTYPWCKNVSLKDFCEYILPYRGFDEHLTPGWRKVLMKRYSWLTDSVGKNTDMAHAYAYLHKNIYNWNKAAFNSYPFSLSIDQILKVRGSQLCQDESNMYLYACRAMGITTVTDMVPGWGRKSNNKHLWNVLIDEDGRTLSVYENEFWPKQNNNIDASIFRLREPGIKYFTRDIKIQESKGITHVYRKMFSKQIESLSIRNKTNEEIPEFFRINTIIDVTPQYFTGSNITIKNIKGQQKFIYLCVYNNSEWTAHLWAQRNGDSAEFKGLGYDVMYLPALYSNGEYTPVGNPFWIDSVNNVSFIKPKTEKKITLIVDRKYPIFANIFNYMNEMLNGTFELANKRDFSDTFVVGKVKETPYFVQQIQKKTTRPFRYLLFKPAFKKFSNLAELSILTKKGNQWIELPSVPFCKEVRKDVNNITDRDYLTYSKANIDSWLGLDLGRTQMPQEIQIRYCPRNDNNNISPENEYELYYWDNKWISLGKQKPNGYYIEYQKVPADALLLLRCNQGNEERIFLYKDGKQIWF